MGQLIAGYEVRSFKIYREFWTADSAIEQFTTEKGNRYSDGELVIELRREHEGLWSVVMRNSPDTIWGEIELFPSQSETLVKIIARDRFDRIGALIIWLASEINTFVQSKRLIYPPKGDSEAGRGSEPQTVIKDNHGVIAIAEGDINVSGGITGRDNVTNQVIE